MGYRTALVPIARDGTQIQWYLETSQRGQIGSRELASARKTWLKSENYLDFADTRCILDGARSLTSSLGPGLFGKRSGVLDKTHKGRHCTGPA